MCCRQSGMRNSIVVRIVMGARVRRVSAVGEIGEAAGRIASMMMIMARTMKAMGDGVTEVKGAEEPRERAEET